jgi:hypothetical protein
MRRIGWIAVVAVLLIGTGTAGAARLLTGKDIKNNSLTGLDIKNGSVGPSDMSDAAMSVLMGDSGPAGAAGAAGPPGPTGVANITGVSAREVLCSGETNCSIAIVRAMCPPGTRPVSGGGASVSRGGMWITSAVTDSSGATGWATGGDNYGSAAEGYVEAYAYCSSGVATFTGTRALIAAREPDLIAQRIAMHK